MEKDEIVNMPAGHEMDALVAERVMGWQYIDSPRGYRPFWNISGRGDVTQDIDWSPSTDISAAWEVVKEMSAKNYWCHTGVLSSTCFALFSTIKPVNQFKAEAATYDLPLAICRAALLAVVKGKI